VRRHHRVETASRADLGGGRGGNFRTAVNLDPDEGLPMDADGRRLSHANRHDRRRIQGHFEAKLQTIEVSEELARSAAAKRRHRDTGFAVVAEKRDGEAWSKRDGPAAVHKKECTHCKELLLAQEFKKQSDAPTGLASQCSICMSARLGTEFRAFANQLYNTIKKMDKRDFNMSGLFLNADDDETSFEEFCVWLAGRLRKTRGECSGIERSSCTHRAALGDIPSL